MPIVLLVRLSGLVEHDMLPWWLLFLFLFLLLLFSNVVQSEMQSKETLVKNLGPTWNRVHCSTHSVCTVSSMTYRSAVSFFGQRKLRIVCLVTRLLRPRFAS